MVRPFSEFEPVLERNLGAHWRYRFTEIDTDVPLGAASIAQVYRAVQRDGQEVVLKIQRPGVAASTRLDMEILAQAVKLAMKRMPTIAEIFQPEAMLEVVFSAMRPEIDFTIEAANMEEFREMLEDFEHLRVPDVLDVTKEVLIMSKAPGVSIRECDLEEFNPKEREADRAGPVRHAVPRLHGRRPVPRRSPSRQRVRGARASRPRSSTSGWSGASTGGWRSATPGS